MAKSTGLSWTTFSIDDSGGSPQAMKNDITNHQFATPRAVQDVTGIDKAAFERLLLLADFSVTVNGVADFAAGATAHTVFSTVPSTSVARTVTMVVTAKTLANEVLFTDYSFTRAQDGSLVWTAPGVLADGTVPTWA
jgi:hypothetical protein